MTDTNAAAVKKITRTDDFNRFITGASGILWRMHREERSLELLNEQTVDALESSGKVGDLILDLVEAQKIVIDDDFFRYKMFIKNIREGLPANGIFRVRDRKGQYYWLKMGGCPGQKEPHYYYGFINDITEDVTFINNLLEKDLARQTIIQHDDRPVMLIDMKTRAVISRNTLAYNLFGYTFDDFNKITFRDLYPVEEASDVSAAYENCILDGLWDGQLRLIKKNREIITARVKFKRLTIQDKNLLRMSVVEILNGGSTATFTAIPVHEDAEQFSKRLMEAIAQKKMMADVLDTLLENPYGDFSFEAIMYADVQIKKHRVDVYARGDAFESIAFGASYEYEGTISQMLKENQLEYLIVEDTLESTKPIDWALFIPQGIRSYYAQPLYHGKNLRTVLLFCSTEKNRFCEKDRKIYQLYYPAFSKGLKNWRKYMRTPKKSQ
jgi:hypothetical protein